jgi:tRNA A-37 threonylcarbamoyl transferase component Bud32
MAEPPADLVAPRGWELAGELATGASAIVMRLRGKRPREAALKLGRWRHPDLLARFAQEAEVLRGIGSPTTPQLFEDGVLEGRPYLVMELIPGETLASWMIDPRRASHVGKIIAMLVQLADALAGIHRAGYVHRDLKPENVMYGDLGPRILDLGLARRPNEVDSTSVPDVVGTVHYLAPEQIGPGELVDQRADLYSLGVIAFELLAGVPPFIGERRAIEYQHRFVRPPRISRTRRVPGDLDTLVAQCMSKQPGARPQTAMEIADRLRRIFAELRTLPGVGPTHVRASDIVTPEPVAILWADSHDSDAVASVIAEHHGHVVRRVADGLVAVFASSELEQPATAAHAAARELASSHAVIIHVATAVVRYPVDGAVGAYGDAIENAETWSTLPRELGVTFTDAAVHELGQRVAVSRLATERTTTELVGRTGVIDEILGLIERSPSRLISISGAAGLGKTRILDEIAEHVHGRDVLHIRAWRGFAGELGDDGHAIAELEPSARDPFDALRAAAQRGALVLIDDVQWLSSEFLRALVRPGLPGTRIVASPVPLFATTAAAIAHTAIELAPLGHADSATLLRDAVQPAHLLPVALVERLILRGTGTPRLLLALARELVRRGAIRRSSVSGDWYVADDELDTLLEPPGPPWLAARLLEGLAGELEPIVRMCAGLGAQFAAAEAAAVTGASGVSAHLDALCHAGVLERRGDSYRFANADIQTAIYDHMLDTRSLVHARALAFTLDHPDLERRRWLARVAFHATGSANDAIASACCVALAADALIDQPAVAALLAQSRRACAALVPPALAAAIRGD